MRLLYLPCMNFFLFWLTCIQLSCHNDLHLLSLTLLSIMNLAFGHTLKSAAEFLSRFAPAACTFIALEHEMTRSLVLIYDPVKPRIILQNSSSSFDLCLSYLCTAYCLADSDLSFKVMQCSTYPICSDFSCSRFPCINHIQIWTCLAHASRRSKIYNVIIIINNWPILW